MVGRKQFRESAERKVGKERKICLERTEKGVKRG